MYVNTRIELSRKIEKDLLGCVEKLNTADGLLIKIFEETTENNGKNETK